MTIDKDFWQNKKVFLTGHTGFKGSWLTLLLDSLEAQVFGYALAPETEPSLFALANVNKHLETSTIADISSREELSNALDQAQPDVIFHLAAQPLVRRSYKNPIETYQTNIIGTVNLLEAAKDQKQLRALINVTTDKVYANAENPAGYVEEDTLGGHDPYACSKACSELVSKSYRDCFYSEKIGLATARAGNVIGGGDWSEDRLIPDCIRAIKNEEAIEIRYPKAIRPWQHVLESLSGYLILAQNLYENPDKFSQAWNFGPQDADFQTVEWLVQSICESFNHQPGYIVNEQKHLYETTILKLLSNKSYQDLNWLPKWNLEQTLKATTDWYLAYLKKADIYSATLEQINSYLK